MGMDREERQRIDMLLEGRKEEEIARKANRDALRSGSLAAFVGGVS